MDDSRIYTSPRPDERDAERKATLNWEVGRKPFIAPKDAMGRATYLYHEQYNDVVKYCDEASKLINGEGVESTRETNTVIGIAGERGSGKSSFLYSLKDALGDRYHVLDIVDPSDFGTDMSILEFFLAHIFEAYRGIYPEYEARCGELAALSLHSKFKKLMKTLSTLRIDKSLYNDENPSVEILSDMTDRIKARQCISEVCRGFLHMTNTLLEPGESKQRGLVLCVDDMDLVDNDHAYRMLEDMRKFLSGNVVLIITYREQQLFNAVLNKKYDENDRLLRHRVVVAQELQDQAHRYLSKLFPEMRAVHLFGQKELLSKPLGLVLGALDADGSVKNPDERVRSELLKDGPRTPHPESLSLKDWIDSTLYAKTLINIDPVSSAERTPYNYPKNLREMLAFAELLHEKMDSFSPSDSSPDRQPFYRRCLRNLDRYRQHLMSNLYDVLSSEDIGQLTAWSEQPAEEKNHYAYGVFSTRYFKVLADDPASESGEFDRAGVDGLLAIHLTSPENVCLGDVSDLINRYEGACVEDGRAVYFSYVFKLLYSIELLSLFLEAAACEHSNDEGRTAPDAGRPNEALEHYLALVNACPVSPKSSMSSTAEEFYYPRVREIENFLIRIDHLERDAEDAISIQLEAFMREHGNDAGEAAYGIIGDLLSTFAYTSIPFSSAIIDSACPRFGFGGKVERGYRKRAVYSYGSEPYPSFKVGRSYTIDPLSLIAKRTYVECCLETLLHDFDESPGFYILYSLFDLDALQSLTFDKHGVAEDRLREHMARYNSAIRLAYRKRIGADPTFNSSTDETASAINVPQDRAASTHLCSAFVRDDGYRLFPLAGMNASRSVAHAERPADTAAASPDKDFPSFESLCLAYAIASAVHRHLEVPLERKNEMNAFIDRMSKPEFLSLSKTLVKLLVEPEQKRLLHTLEEQLERHRTSHNTRVSIGDREALRAILKEHPQTFVEGYNELSSHE